MCEEVTNLELLMTSADPLQGATPISYKYTFIVQTILGPTEWPSPKRYYFYDSKPQRFSIAGYYTGCSDLRANLAEWDDDTANYE